MSFMSSNPAIELSSNLPTNGETYAAPAFADSIACATSKIKVTFPPSKYLHPCND